MTTTYSMVTGASSGIGEAFARRLAKEKRNLILVARRTDRLKKLQEELAKQHNIIVHIFSVDLTSNDNIDNLFQAIAQQNFKIDICINNAGSGKYAPVATTPWSAMQTMINLNIVSLTRVSESMVKIWREQKSSGHILNVASIGAYSPLANFAVYTGTKSYVKTFSLALREELKNENIKVTCLCPGGTATEFEDNAGQALTSFARNTLMTADECARLGLKGLHKNKAIVIPGISNWFLCYISYLLPEPFIVALASRVFSLFVVSKN